MNSRRRANINRQALNSNSFFPPLAVKHLFCTLCHGQRFLLSSEGLVSHPPPSCYPPLLYLLFKAYPLHFCQSNFTAGSCQIQPQTAMASNNSLVLKGQRSHTEPCFSFPRLCRCNACKKPFSAQLQLKVRTGDAAGVPACKVFYNSY